MAKIGQYLHRDRAIAESYAQLRLGPEEYPAVLNPG
jgi:hypothetical protein